MAALGDRVAAAATPPRFGGRLRGRRRTTPAASDRRGLADAERAGRRAGGADPRGAVAGRTGLVERPDRRSGRRARRGARRAGRRVGGGPPGLEPGRPSWSGAGADGAAEFAAATVAAADALAMRVEPAGCDGARPPARRWRAPTHGCRTSSSDFEARAAALEPHLDSPGVADELIAEAQRSLDEAVAVVDELARRVGRARRRFDRSDGADLPGADDTSRLGESRNAGRWARASAAARR